MFVTKTYLFNHAVNEEIDEDLRIHTELDTVFETLDRLLLTELGTSDTPEMIVYTGDADGNELTEYARLVGVRFDWQQPEMERIKSTKTVLAERTTKAGPTVLYQI